MKHKKQQQKMNEQQQNHHPRMYSLVSFVKFLILEFMSYKFKKISYIFLWNSKLS